MWHLKTTCVCARAASTHEDVYSGWSSCKLTWLNWTVCSLSSNVAADKENKPTPKNNNRRMWSKNKRMHHTPHTAHAYSARKVHAPILSSDSKSLSITRISNTSCSEHSKKNTSSQLQQQVRSNSIVEILHLHWIEVFLNNLRLKSLIANLCIVKIPVNARRIETPTYPEDAIRIRLACKKSG